MTNNLIPFRDPAVSISPSLAKLLQAARDHNDAEAALDTDATVATMEGEPIYDLWPIGLRLTGRDFTKKYYEYYAQEYAKNILEYKLIGEWVGSAGLLQEYAIKMRHLDNSIEDYSVACVLTFGTNLLTGERIYADEKFLKALFAPFWDDAVPIKLF